MMKLRFAFLIITSFILLNSVTCYEGVYKIPEMSSKVDVQSIVPKCFMDSVNEHVIRQTGYRIKGQIIDLNSHRHVFEKIVSKIRDETLELLDKFTVLIVAMVERNKDMRSLGSVFNYVELNISKLSGCLEFLYDNGADVTDALTKYIFYSDIKYILTSYYGEGYTYKNVIDIMFVRFTRQQWLEYVQIVPTEEAYQKIYREVDKSLEDISKVYQQPIVKPSNWLFPQRLKWRHLLESNSNIADKFKQVIVVDNENIFNQYLQTAHEFDSMKVMDFYVKVGKVLDNIVLRTAIDLMKSLMYLILRLIAEFSNKDHSFTEVNRAKQTIDVFLGTVVYFENWMSYSKRLKSTEQLQSSPVIGMLRESVKYCNSYDASNFPIQMAPFLNEFKSIIEKHVPNIKIDLTKIRNDLCEDSTSESIIDDMEKNMKLIKALLEETSTT